MSSSGSSNSNNRNLKIALAAGAGIVAAGLAWWAYSSYSGGKCCKKAKNPAVLGERVKTPFGYGFIDAKQPETPTGLLRVHLPNKTMGFLNKESVTKLDASEAIFVRTPFGLGELLAPPQATPDLVGDKNQLFIVKLPFANAYVNHDSIRVANFEPFPSVETPDGPGRVLEPVQDGPVLTPNADKKFVVQLDGKPISAAKSYPAASIERMSRGHNLDN